MFFENIFRQLEKRKIRYLVIGGVAVNLHGYSRMTADLDVLLSMDKRNLGKFVQMVKFLGWKPRVPVAIEELLSPRKRKNWIQEKNMKVFTVYNPEKEMEEIDILIQGAIDFKNAYKKRVEYAEGDLKVSVVSIPDLIRLKKIAGRKLDLFDIETLNKIRDLKDAKSKLD